MRAPCRLWRTTLVARVLDTGYPPAFLESHVSTCLRCQAVTAHSRRLRRTLATIEPGPVTLRPDGTVALPSWMAAGLVSVVAAMLMVKLRHGVR